ncbi:MAG: hypothetical protein Q8L88_02310 [Bacteroidota bacterium]|nr:hypothetical protein [Bacteroidota bacterium]
MYSTIVLLKSSGVSQGFTDLQEAEDAAVAGDCIIVYPGTYALGAGQLILKNGVNKKFLPGVTISSDHANGTIIDNNVACVQTWEGEPTITNTNGLNKRIVLQHASSECKGFFWEYEAVMFQSDTLAPSAGQIIKNTLGGTPAWVYDTVGSYQAILNNAFLSDKTFVSVSAGLSKDVSESPFALSVAGYAAGLNVIGVSTGNPVANGGEFGNSFTVHVKVKP